jgi:hypothetical protein
VTSPVPHVTVADLERRLGRSLFGADYDRAEADIEDTAALVSALFHLTDPPQPLALTLIARVALRAFKNPNGVTQESLGSRSVTFADTDRKPGVYLTTDELGWPLPRRSKVYSVRLTTPQDHL